MKMLWTVCSFEPFDSKFASPHLIVEWKLWLKINSGWKKNKASKMLWIHANSIPTLKSQLKSNSTRHCSVSFDEQWMVYFCHSIVYCHCLTRRDKHTNPNKPVFINAHPYLLGWCGKLTVKPFWNFYDWKKKHPSEYIRIFSKERGKKQSKATTNWSGKFSLTFQKSQITLHIIKPSKTIYS